MITEAFYKDRKAVILQNEHLSATFLPFDGAKLVSLKDKTQEEYLAQREGERYRVLGIDTGYVSAECSAFDDMFPTVDPCTINNMPYLDHGEVARIPHSFEIANDAVTFSCRLDTLGINYQKTAFLKDETLYITYKIQNLNDFSFPYIWAGHIMLRGEDGIKATSPLQNSPTAIMFGAPQGDIDTLCAFGKSKEWKYYYTSELSPFCCAVEYPKSNRKVSVGCSGDTIRYLGVWLNPGDLNNMYNIALEPCSALYDSPEKAGDTLSYINPHETIEFTLSFKIESR